MPFLKHDEGTVRPKSTLAETISSRKKAWTLPELAELLNCSKGKLYKMVKSGRIPHLRLGTTILFDPKMLSGWVEAKIIVG